MDLCPALADLPATTAVDAIGCHAVSIGADRLMRYKQSLMQQTKRELIFCMAK